MSNEAYAELLRDKDVLSEIDRYKWIDGQT